MALEDAVNPVEPLIITGGGFEMMSRRLLDNSGSLSDKNTGRVFEMLNAGGRRWSRTVRP